MKSNIHVHMGDLPSDFAAGDSIAIDTEAMGLNIARDRLCLVQISTGNKDAHLIRIQSQNPPENLTKILENESIIKIFHFARFDVSIIYKYFSIKTKNIYCTKIASKLCRTYTDKHSLKDLCKEMLGIDLNKQEQTSDWGASELKPTQMEYAAQDVLHLHRLKTALDQMLLREDRLDLAQECFRFLPVRAFLDARGFPDIDIFAHA